MSEQFLAGDPAPLLYADTHPALCAAHGRRGERLAVGASVVGRRHVRGYRARDDAFVLAGSGEYMVAAVADGVGGEMYTRIGAAHCVHALCRELLGRVSLPHIRRTGVDDFDPATLPRDVASLGVPRDMPTLAPGATIQKKAANWDSSGSFHGHWRPYRRRFPTDLFEDDEPPPAPPRLSEALLGSWIAARESFLALAAGLRVKPRKLTCTLLVVAVELATGDTVVAQLGDGAILRMEDLMPAVPASPPKDDDVPFTIADDDWQDGLRVAESKAGGFILMTDGVSEFFPQAGPACRELLMRPGDDAERALLLLNWLQSLERQDCEDDRTLAAILLR